MLLWLLVAFVGTAFWSVAAEPETGSSLTKRGVAAANQKNYPEAESLFRRAADVWRSLGPSYEPHLGITLTNLGETLSAQGKRAEAAQSFEGALAVDRRALGPTHILTLTALNCLAGTLSMLGDLDRAEALYEEALPVLREHHPEDVQLARTLAGLSGLRVIERKLDEAERFGDEALTLALQAEGEDGPDVAGMYATAAEVHRAAGRPERALPLYRKALALYERRLGPDHPRVAQVRGQLGNTLMQDGKPGMAEQELHRALDILSRTCPSCYREQSIIEANLGILQLREGKLQDADQYLSHVLALQESYIARPGIEVAETLQTLAAIRLKERRFDEAAQLASRANRLAYR